MQQRKYARRRYIINWRFQLRYIVFTIIPIILLGIFTAGVGFKVAYDMATKQRQQLIVMISSLEASLKNIEDFISDKGALSKAVEGIRSLKAFSQDLVAINMMEFQRLTYALILAMAVLVGGAIFFGVLFSHRIAGPIFRLERNIREMSQRGVLNTPIRIRSHDEFQDLAACIEQLRLSILDRCRQCHDELLVIGQVLDKIDSGLDKGIAPSKQDMEKLKTGISGIKKYIEYEEGKV